MKIVATHELIAKGTFGHSDEWRVIPEVVHKAIERSCGRRGPTPSRSIPSQGRSGAKATASSRSKMPPCCI